VLEKLSGLVGLSVSGSPSFILYLRGICRDLKKNFFFLFNRAAAEKSRLTLKELESTEKDLKNSIEELDNVCFWEGRSNKVVIFLAPRVRLFRKRPRVLQPLWYIISMR